MRGSMVCLAGAVAALSGSPWGTPSTALADAGAGPAGDESEELRTLRLAEERLFGTGPGDAADAAGDRVLRSGERPTEPADGLPGASPLEDAAPLVEGTPRAAWLAELALPDLPVRWDERVVDYLEYFRNDPRGRRLIEAWLERMAAFAGPIRAVLREHGLPEDLIFVAMVESGFDPTARSRAGAAGLWQFVPRTGAAYGLRQDRFVDQRLDPVASTEAAARHLADLHRRLGRWELALAAYNMGYGALLRAIRKYNTNDYWLLSHLEAGLPFETTLYVAKVVACAIAGHNPAAFGLDPGKSVPEPPALTEVRVPAGTPLGLVARAARIDREALSALNPAYLRGRTPPSDGPWAVQLPAEAAPAFARRWPRVARSRRASRPYVVRLGEDLRDIARRFGTTVGTLRGDNGLEDEDPAPGETILVPAVEPREEPRSAVRDVPVPAGEPAPELGDRLRRFYEIQRGDTLSEVAQFAGVTIDDLCRWNAVDRHAVLQPGMVLQLFLPGNADLSRIRLLEADEVRTHVLGSEAFLAHHESQQGRRRVEVRVRPGDTLTSIGQRFGLTPEDLARINQRGVDDVLRLGERLVVYADEDDPRVANDQDDDDDHQDR